MKLRRRTRSLMICLTVATLSAWARGQVAQESAADHVVRGAVTEPSKRLKLQFDTIGVIKDVLVEPGDRVQSGQVLAAQDDYVEQKSLEALLVEASSQYSVEAQKADEAIKKVVLERKRRMYETNVSSNSEVEEAELELKFASTRIKLEEEKTTLKKIEADQQKHKVIKMKLVSPVDGIVEKISVGPGEMADINDQDGAVIVVKNDPLWVVIRDLSTAQAEVLEIGQMIDVRYGDLGKWTPAKVIFKAPVADAASDTRVVRLEMPNPENKATGLHVQVKLPAEIANAGAVAGASKER